MLTLTVGVRIYNSYAGRKIDFLQKGGISWKKHLSF